MSYCRPVALLLGFLSSLVPCAVASGQRGGDAELERVMQWVRTRKYDSIPAIDRPVFVRADSAGYFVKPGDQVIGIAGNGVAKAYPIELLNGREVVNDVLDDQPVTVTW